MCDPETPPFMSPRAKRGVPRHLRASGRQKGKRAEGWHGGGCRTEPSFLSPQGASRGVPWRLSALERHPKAPSRTKWRTPFRAKRGMPSSRSARQEKDARQDKVGELFEQPRVKLTKTEILLLKR